MQNDQHTSENILCAAEEVFADNGIAATSLRAIVKKAGANVAAIHYHFGSKEALIRAVFHRHIEPINNERLALLNALEADTSPITMEQLVHAFLAPMFHYFARQPQRVRGLFARLHSEPQWTRPILQQHHKILERFQQAFMHVAPELSAGQVRFRMTFMMGSMGIILSPNHPLLNGEQREAQTMEKMLSEIIKFNAAGMAAQAK
ncbi:MAG: TetR/AcrR family transcriptional regulator [Calditrichaeota bacterium]|nr:MAG: TetR/AcrR family transcriptional regulator [Calditrichota bacterium]